MDHLARFCPTCQLGVSPDHRRCPACGVRLVAERPSQQRTRTSSVGGSPRPPDHWLPEVGEAHGPAEAERVQKGSLVRRLVLGILFALLVALARAFL